MSNDQLKRSFLAEDSQTWTQAARRLGLMGDAKLPFLQRQLADTKNLTARRHGWGMLAAYLEAIDDEQAEATTLNIIVSKTEQPEKVTIGHWIRDWLSGIILRGLDGTDTPLGELRVLPGVPERIHVRLEKLQEELETQRQRGNERAVAAKKRGIAALRDETTPIRDVKGLAPDPIHDEEWIFASFLACLSPGFLERIGVPLALLLPAMVRLSVTRSGQRIGYVIYGPKLVQEAVAAGLLETDTAASLLQDMADAITPAPTTNQGTWLEHVSRLREAIETTRVKVDWKLESAFAGMEPPELERLFVTWCDETTERHAIELARACLDTFQRESQWREMSHGQRLSLPAFVLVTLDPGKGSGRWRTFSLEHRIQIVLEAIERWRQDNDVILESLVRLLKILFQRELEREASKRDGNVVAVCRRQLFAIQPLVAAWNLRGVINKDLAAIAVQALGRCHDHCLQSGDLSEYRRLLYTMLYAVPDLDVLRGMQRYAQSEQVAVHLEKIVAFAVEQDSTPEGLEERYVDFAHSLWSERSQPSLDGFLDLVDSLCPTIDEETAGELDQDSPSPFLHLGEEARNALQWMVETREALEVETDQPRHGGASPVYMEEMAAEIEVRTRDVLQKMGRTLASFLAERQTIIEASRPEVCLRAMQQAVNSLSVLQSLCRETLPFVERRVVVVKLRHAIRTLEHRLDRLSRIMEGEHEAEAKRLVHDREVTGSERKLIANWMLRRFMLPDLVTGGSVLRKLLDIRFVALWILTPYLATAIITSALGARFNSPSFQWLAGVPFLIVIVGNIALVLAYGLKKNARLPGELSRGHLMLPQMVGALFLGLMGSFQSDESWSLAFLGSPITRVLNVVVFLTASYYFIRLVMLGNQHPRGQVSEKTVLRKRAWSVMALGLWQSFALTSLFSLLMGNVMSSSYRADLGVNELDALSQWFGRFVPHMIKIGSSTILSVYIFPWAILTWTVKLFFFSAIFERIMNRYGD